MKARFTPVNVVKAHLEPEPETWVRLPGLQ